MIKSIIKNALPAETWSNFSSQKRHIQLLFKHSKLDPNLKNETKILIIGVADYNNLGDHAIAHAQRAFLEKVIGAKTEFKIVEIPSRTPVRHIKNIINDKDIILFTGGGNLGTKYRFLQDVYLPIIEKYPNNQKLFFPQSYTFNDEGDSIKLMNKIKSVFAASGDKLTITARESKSEKLFKEFFLENNIITAPDIVLSLNTRNKRDEKEVKTTDILMLMRDEGEKVLTFKTQHKIIDALKVNYDVTVHENDNSYDVSPENRLKELNIKWDEIKQSKVVITDRLHGMIFSQIAGIPCIVFDNYNSKIKMTCETWLHDVDNILFIDSRNEINIDKFTTLVSNLMGKSVPQFDIDTNYEPLAETLRSFIK
ncbi:Conserved hypothetical protein (containing a Polysaccharide pyruvyl transferase) [Pseudolactococcus piscium]|nr:Conserved hypothetical protein (containing a Polysaccharide pyruvyl transferase) [Lactococcus piscium]